MPESSYPSTPGRLKKGGGAKDADLPTYPPTPDKLTTPPSPTGGGPGSGSGSGFNRRAFIKATPI